MSAAEPHPTLRALLGRAELGLRLASGQTALEQGALDAELRWVHSSDLIDPTPFLADDLLLLTTGTQFAGGSAAEYTDYVVRLRTRGVRGLGFGTEVVREGIPGELIDACARLRMPLFEVPYRTPFIAVARANAEAIAAQAYARRTWALSAQRAISLAALRPDGLAATVAELAKQLGAWVGLYDAAGALTHGHPADSLGPAVRAALDAEVDTVLRRGARAASQLEADGVRLTLQTLGRGGHLRGVIAIAGADLDLESRSVVTAVIAMAGLSLEQNVGLVRARTALRAGLVQALLEGQVDLVRRVSGELWGPPPAGPVVVAVGRIAPERTDAAVAWLELRGAEARGALFHGPGPNGHVLLTPTADLAVLRAFAAAFAVPVGCSEPTGYQDIARAHAQAVTAAGNAEAGTVAAFAAITDTGVLSALDSVRARALADARLRPLHTYDRAHGTALVDTVRVWLESDARIDLAAHTLGIHRHTVRARVGQAQQLLGLDLGSFPARAELWAALVATG